jgi:transcriptional regulator with XRE-family HTH domain
MGNGGKQVERQRARELRAEAWTLQEIAEELGVSKGSVSAWVRDVVFVPKPRNRGHDSQRPHPLHLRKLAEIERCRVEAEALIGTMSPRDLTMFCLALYAGEGSKTEGAVSLANTDPILLALFARWLRDSFSIDESRLRMRLHLHDDLDLEAATRFWSSVTGVPVDQFTKPYRPPAGPGRKIRRHLNGCATMIYSCSLTHRRVMAMVEAVSSSFAFRDSSVGRAGHC